MPYSEIPESPMVSLPSDFSLHELLSPLCLFFFFFLAPYLVWDVKLQISTLLPLNYRFHLTVKSTQSYGLT